MMPAQHGLVRVYGESYRIVAMGPMGTGKFFGRGVATLERVADGTLWHATHRSGKVAWNARLNPTTLETNR